MLENLLRRYRRVWRQRYCPFGLRLIWHKAGRVWAMDFSKAAYPIDGLYTHIFSVRDLASHYQLVWQPVDGERADEVLRILTQLFDQYGRPLVVKNDNGPAFLAEVLRLAMGEQHVSQLFSPAGRPSYNGGLERSNGVNKMYTGQHAMSQGHPFQWLSADLEAARNLANDISRPWDAHGPTPREAWEARTPLSDQERTQFVEKLSEQRQTAATELGIELAMPLNHKDRSRLDRHALATILQQLGYLTYKRGKRYTQKPRRATREEIEKRTPPSGNGAEPSPTDVAAVLPPILTTRPCVDNARRVATAERPQQASAPAAQSAQTIASRAEPAARAGSTPSSDTNDRSDVVVIAALADLSTATTHLPRAGPEEVLAQTPRACTMQTDDSTHETAPNVRLETPSTQRERTTTSWWRSPVTPLISILKAAKIMR